MFLAVALLAVSAISCHKEPAPGKLVGDVTYKDKQIVGVDVTLTGDNGTFTFTTITDGYFYFNTLPPGDYIVSCRYNGKEVDSYLKNYEKSENPSKVTILEGELHSRNVLIPDEVDMGIEEDD